MYKSFLFSSASRICFAAEKGTATANNRAKKDNGKNAPVEETSQEGQNLVEQAKAFQDEVKAEVEAEQPQTIEEASKEPEQSEVEDTAKDDNGTEEQAPNGEEEQSSDDLIKEAARLAGQVEEQTGANAPKMEDTNPDYVPEFTTAEELNEAANEIHKAAGIVRSAVNTLRGQAISLLVDHLMFRRSKELVLQINGMTEPKVYPTISTVKDKDNIGKLRQTARDYLRDVWDYRPADKVFKTTGTGAAETMEVDALSSEGPSESSINTLFNETINCALLVLFKHKGFTVNRFVKDGKTWRIANDGEHEIAVRQPCFVLNEFAPFQHYMNGKRENTNVLVFASSAAVKLAWDDFNTRYMGGNAPLMNEFGEKPTVQRKPAGNAGTGTATPSTSQGTTLVKTVPQVTDIARALEKVAALQNKGTTADAAAQATDASLKAGNNETAFDKANAGTPTEPAVGNTGAPKKDDTALEVISNAKYALEHTDTWVRLCFSATDKKSHDLPLAKHIVKGTADIAALVDFQDEKRMGDTLEIAHIILSAANTVLHKLNFKDMAVRNDTDLQDVIADINMFVSAVADEDVSAVETTRNRGND
jgi:hypothetical protein